MTNDVLSAALAWSAAGASVIPIRADGSKKPLVEWKKYQTERADEQQIRTWFTNTNYGLAVICGSISGNLEMTEIEGRVAENSRLLNAIDDELERHRVDQIWALLKSCYQEWTPSGGIHVFYRLAERPDGNRKLANAPSTDESGNPIALTLAETRGEGGYVIVAPSAGKVHATGEAWQLVTGSVEQISFVERDVRDTIHQALHAALDSMPPEPERVAPSYDQDWKPETTRPGDAWSGVTPWRDILEPHGWTYSHSHAGSDFWTRPGKEVRAGISASTREDGNLYVWSSSAGLPTEHPITKLYVLAHYEHHGDIAAAAGALRKLGYGEDRNHVDSDFYADYPTKQTSPKGPEGGSEGATIRTTTLRIRPASSFTIKRVRWLWDGRVPLGELTLVPGREGVGKSLMLAKTAADITRGLLPGEFFGQCRPVFYVASEDSWNHTIAPRMKAAGANMDLIFCIDVDPISELPPGAPILPRDCEDIAEMAREVKAGALMLDPIVSLVEGGYDTYKAPDLRRVLEPLRRAADYADLGVMALVHFNKSSGTDISSKIAGSRAWVEVARAAIAVARMPQEEPDESNEETFFQEPRNRVVVSQIKNNLGVTELPNLTYEIDSMLLAADDGMTTSVGVITWGEETDMSADQAMENHKKKDADVGQKTNTILAYIRSEYARNALAVHAQEVIEHFADSMERPAVYAHLSRLVKQGKLIRPRQGMYAPPTEE